MNNHLLLKQRDGWRDMYPGRMRFLFLSWLVHAWSLVMEYSLRQYQVCCLHSFMFVLQGLDKQDQAPEHYFLASSCLVCALVWLEKKKKRRQNIYRGPLEMFAYVSQWNFNYCIIVAARLFFIGSMKIFLYSEIWIRLVVWWNSLAEDWLIHSVY